MCIRDRLYTTGTWGNLNIWKPISSVVAISGEMSISAMTSNDKSRMYSKLLGISDEYDEKATIAGAMRWLKGTLEYVTSNPMPADAGQYLMAVKLLAASCTFMVPYDKDSERTSLYNHEAHKLLKSKSEAVLHGIAVKGEKDICIANKLCDALGKIYRPTDWLFPLSNSLT